MANEIFVTLAELTAAANKLDQSVANYEQASKNMKAAADNLGSTWEGDSRVAFVTQQERVQAWYADMIRIVRTYSEALKKARDEYENADKTSASEIKKR